MTVKELIEILKDYTDEADVQINICNGFNTESAESFSIDEEYNKHESFVIHANMKEK